MSRLSVSAPRRGPAKEVGGLACVWAVSEPPARAFRWRSGPLVGPRRRADSRGGPKPTKESTPQKTPGMPRAGFGWRSRPLVGRRRKTDSARGPKPTKESTTPKNHRHHLNGPSSDPSTALAPTPPARAKEVGGLAGVSAVSEPSSRGSDRRSGPLAGPRRRADSRGGGAAGRNARQPSDLR